MASAAYVQQAILNKSLQFVLPSAAVQSPAIESPTWIPRNIDLCPHQLSLLSDYRSDWSRSFQMTTDWAV